MHLVFKALVARVNRRDINKFLKELDMILDKYNKGYADEVWYDFEIED